MTTRVSTLASLSAFVLVTSVGCAACTSSNSDADAALGTGDAPRIDARGAVGDGPRPDVPAGVGEPAELVGITLLHNEARAAVLTATPLPSMEWDPALAATAAAWVAQCQNTDGVPQLIDHNPGRSTGHPWYVGENIYASGGTAIAADAVGLWMSEAGNYNYTANTCTGTCGHYTQIVWRDSVKLGCAVGNCPSIPYPSSIVCDYGPGGNIGNQRPY